ncbi:11379_t:CDS:2 [Gigaspora rosea]|nr:11379_t:CDS:2 [Gigaspora rosea]
MCSENIQIYGLNRMNLEIRMRIEKRIESKLGSEAASARNFGLRFIEELNKALGRVLILAIQIECFPIWIHIRINPSY